MKFRLTFFSSLLIGLLLLSEQVFATAYYSIPGGAGLWSNPATWSSNPCGGGGGGSPVAAPLATDTLTICDSSAIPGFVIEVDAVSVGASATVNLGGILDLSSNVLTLSGALTNDGGMILSGVQALVAQSIIHKSGTTNLTGVTTNTTNSITVNGPGLQLSPKLIGINGLFTSSVNFTMPSTVLLLTGGIAVTGGILALDPLKNIVTGNVVVNSGVGIDVTGRNGGTLISPTTNLPTTPTPCPSGTHRTVTSAGAYDCVANPISAPIFSTKEKARVFTEEIL